MDIKLLPPGDRFSHAVTGYSAIDASSHLIIKIAILGSTAIQAAHWIIGSSYTVRAQRSHWHRCDMHSGVIDSAVQISHHICEALATFEGNSYAMQILKNNQRSQWHRCEVHSGVTDSAVTCTAESLTPLCKYGTAVTFDITFARLWLPLKGISIENHT
jgi:uncharacterized protein (UPF0179 family)